jgi:hypothetical protein
VLEVFPPIVAEIRIWKYANGFWKSHASSAQY